MSSRAGARPHDFAARRRRGGTITRCDRPETLDLLRSFLRRVRERLQALQRPDFLDRSVMIYVAATRP